VQLKETSRLILVLTVISAITGLVVALAERLTRAPIARAKETIELAAISEILPSDAGTPVLTNVVMEDGTTNVVYVAGKCVAVRASTDKGYGGKIVLVVGFDAEGGLYNYTVVEHSETPGLGSHIEDTFRASVVGRPAGTTWKICKDGGEIDAITGATMSSRAICDAIADAERIRNRLISERRTDFPVR